jgi:hypothetical protein
VAVGFDGGTGGGADGCRWGRQRRR